MMHVTSSAGTADALDMQWPAAVQLEHRACLGLVSDSAERNEGAC